MTRSAPGGLTTEPAKSCGTSMKRHAPAAGGLSQQEIDTMISPKFVAGRLSGINLRLPRRDRPRRPRGTSVAGLAAADWLLEERCLLSDFEMPLAPPGSRDRYNTVDNLSKVL